MSLPSKVREILSSLAVEEQFDLITTNGTVTGGTGRPRFRADLGVHDSIY